MTEENDQEHQGWGKRRGKRWNAELRRVGGIVPRVEKARELCLNIMVEPGRGSCEGTLMPKLGQEPVEKISNVRVRIPYLGSW